MELKSEGDIRTETWEIKTPIKEELLSPEDLRYIARVEAHKDRVRRKLKTDLYTTIQDELAKNEKFLAWAYNVFQREIITHRELVPTTAEWLLDNYYIIRNQFNLIKGDLPKSYFVELPKLSNGDLKGYPRVYKIAWDVTGHTGSRINREVLNNYLKNYQSVNPLTSGEIWALPIMLRLVLLDNLTRLINESLETLEKRLKANETASKLVQLWEDNKKKANREIRKIGRNRDEYDPTLIIYLIERIRRTEPFVVEMVTAFDEMLDREDINQDEYIRIQNRYRAINRAQVGNTITSLRSISQVDWKKFFEEVSQVEKILRRDPAGIYSQMDFASRDRYRHEIELLSRRSRFNEQEISRKAVQLAQGAAENQKRDAKDIKEGHVGYYLIGEGEDELIDEIEYEGTVQYRLAKFGKENATKLYLGSIGSLTLILAILAHLWLVGEQLNLGFLVLLLVLTSNVAVGLVGWILMSFAKAKPIPKIELKNGVPDNLRTIVVIPCLISIQEDINHLTNNIEKRYISNRDDNIYFALLSDFGDAKEKTMPEDKKLLVSLKKSIDLLNHKYGYAEGEKFMVFHRERLYNKCEKKWMGWERKRGKLIEFNRFVAGTTKNRFLMAVYNHDIIPQLKYAITLDADTQLPLGSAKRLIGTMAHPQNWPEIDEKLQIVTKGYGVIQPRVDTDTVSANRSMFTQIMVADAGLDPYSSVVTDIYQDIFDHSSFVGKAIYDIRVAEQVIGNRFPENWLLSHDLLEGSYLRTGLASDIQLLEDFPTSYNIYAKREHRWIRGDWQIAEWISPWVPSAQGAWVSNPLNMINRWKIADNLRRSLLPLAALATLIGAWLFSPHSLVKWIGLVLFSYLFVLFKETLVILFARINGESVKEYFESGWQGLATIVNQMLLRITLLAHDGLKNADAIIKVFVRQLISKQKMLEWTSFATLEKGNSNNILTHYRSMWPSVLLALGISAYGFQRNGWEAISGASLATLWLLAPLVTGKISQPIQKNKARLEADKQVILRVIGAKIWRFFDEYAGAEDNYLIPDNIQVDGETKIAHRTSPTNIGLELLVELSAYDLGLVNKKDLIDKIERIINTVEKLEKFKGHLYNWYSTQTLEPINPIYVSTVDSGNLVGCLLTLQQGLLNMSEDEPDKQNKIVEGLTISLEILYGIIEQTTETGKFDPSANKILKLLQTIIEDFEIGQNVEISLKSSLNRLEKINEEYQVIRPKLPSSVSQNIDYWLRQIDSHLKRFEQRYDENDMETMLIHLVGRIQKLIRETDFEFLMDKEKMVFTIGYNVRESKLDDSYYDLLASESRIASLVAIAANQVPMDHWFKLSRPVTRINGNIALLSWGGSMFEYLMPSLLMKDFDNSLIKESNDEVVDRQIDYGISKNGLWGISESGFYAFDFDFNYQYRLFGVQDLAFKREMDTNLVFTPYASILALSVRPKETWDNIVRLKELEMEGDYGFYEAIDFTKNRLPKKINHAIVRSYMAHHQGMSLLAINNYINDSIMKKRFHKNPDIQACEVLLQERIPNRVTTAEIPKEKSLPGRSQSTSLIKEYRRITTPHTRYPRMNLLSNGQLTTTITNTGSGSLTYKNFDIFRWRDDPTVDNWGEFVYLKDNDSNQIWSIGYQPTLQEPEEYEAIFSSNKSVLNRRDNDIGSRMEVVISPESNVEIRKITLSNFASRKRSIEVTTYAEIVANEHRADIANMAFSKLFVESRYIEDLGAVLYTRRKKPGEIKPVVGQFMIGTDNEHVLESFECDRYPFIGRGNSAREPRGLSYKLTKKTGVTLDQIAATRTNITLKPLEAKSFYLVTVVGEKQKETIRLIKEFQNTGEIERSWELSEIHTQIENRHLGINQEEANTFIQMASKIRYPEPWLRTSLETREQNDRQQTSFYKYGLSGDHPIVLVRIKNSENIGVIQQALVAHEFLRMKNFGFDLILLAENSGTYSNKNKDEIQTMIDISLSRPWQNQAKGVHLMAENEVDKEDMGLLFGAAAMIIDADFGDIADHLNLYPETQETKNIMLYSDIYTQNILTRKSNLKPQLELVYDNGHGGFDIKNREYVIRQSKNNPTPLPWTNVIANPIFGTVVSESGLGFTFRDNSQLNALTPWMNDNLDPAGGEAIYLQNTETQDIWSPTPWPAGDDIHFTVRHGRGYAKFSSKYKKIRQKLTVWVDKEKPVKLIKLQLCNQSQKTKKIRLAYMAEWVLSNNIENARPWIIQNFDANNEVIMATNKFNNVAFDKVAFLGCDHALSGWSGDRRSFVGQNGSYQKPKGLIYHQKSINNSKNWYSDAAGIIETTIELKPEQTEEVVWILGEADSTHQVIEYKKMFSESKQQKISWRKVKDFWESIGSKIEIETPEKKMDLLVNQWLTYQVISCRYWARTGFYQNSGAYGFRDQLQDTVNLSINNPILAKNQILEAARHQFEEGDVSHWWHPVSNLGVRTRITDDFLWLPWAVATYIKTSGDWDILDEEVPFVQMPLLAKNENEKVGVLTPTSTTTSLLDHCMRAIRNGLRWGPHGLALIGTGDWNDGMNNIGEKGKGESVWLTWFLAKVLDDFSLIWEKRGDRARLEKYRNLRKEILDQAEQNAWDGEWYKRAFFDNGTPLGSKQNKACEIDLIAQSWAVIGGEPDAERKEKLFASVEKKLIKYNEKMILLLTPPFYKSKNYPGYIESYPKGVRENGGQYTHGAVWLIEAYRKNHNGHKAVEIFEMLNPLNHGDTPQHIEKYMLEPYVMAGDVYYNNQHKGRGGWSWYTGSAGWMYRCAIESILGITIVEGKELKVDPCVPDEWQEFGFRYHLGTGGYQVKIFNPEGVSSGVKEIRIDKKIEQKINLVNDGVWHQVSIVMGTT